VKIIPAVDIKGGRCVRLTQGKEDQETVYSDDPKAMAEHWDEQGAQLIHVVDLDGAFQGLPKNVDLIKDIIYSSTVDIQVGGGIRSLEAIAAYVNAGVYRVILGTIAHENPAFVEEACKQFPGKIIIGIEWNRWVSQVLFLPTSAATECCKAPISTASGSLPKPLLYPS
jgi:phosphoribosylformimino-5-aminoimidazole carboxamide ribotide isomerase